MTLVGCAGWSLPRAVQEQFGAGDSHLARYATRFSAVEINSSFHRPHKRSLYEKWADITVDCEQLMLREVVAYIRAQVEA